MQNGKSLVDHIYPRSRKVATLCSELSLPPFESAIAESVLYGIELGSRLNGETPTVTIDYLLADKKAAQLFGSIVQSVALSVRSEEHVEDFYSRLLGKATEKEFKQ